MLDLITGNGLFRTLEQSEFAPLLQNFCLALLTILIPVALAIFQDGDNKDYNRMVIVNKVLKLDDLLLSVFLCFFPTLFWVFYKGNLFHTVLFFIWAIGCQKLINIFLVNFRWVRGEQEEIKIEFISNLKYTDPNFSVAWELIWRGEESLKYREKDYLLLFAQHLNQLLQRQQWQTIEKLIDGFSIHLEKRTIIQLVFAKELLESLLIIHKNSWQTAYNLRDDKNINLWGQVDDVHRKTEELINRIFVISYNNRRSHYFMGKYKSHIESADNPKDYVESTLEMFANTLFSPQLNKDHRFNFWNHEFPQNWMITETNLAGENKVIVLQLFNSYLRWVEEELRKENTDFRVDIISMELFPEIDPMVWLPLLDFILSGFYENRVTTLVKKGWKYGFFGRVRVYSGDPDPATTTRDSKDERKRTYSLIRYINPHLFAEEKLDLYLQILSTYEAQNDNEVKNKGWLITVFNEMKVYYSNSRSN